MKETLSLTGKRWLIKNKKAWKSSNEIIEHLLKERSLGDAVPSALSDPFLFPEMHSAVARIKKAMEAKEIIGIFGDYDADGVTGAAQLVRYFRRHGVEPIVHLPHRAEEGYGLKEKSIDHVKSLGVSLLITVDTGVSAHKEIAYAKTLGIDVIVTDHHRVQGGRPDAFAVIHPIVPEPGFPNTHLSGSGVAFSLVRALEHGTVWKTIEQDVVLAMIGTVGDLVPLTGENRLLVIQGLKLAAKLPPSPLQEFIESVRTPGGFKTSDIAYRVVPRINAAGRMDHPDIALQAILEGGSALQKLHGLNSDRQDLVEKLAKNAGEAADLTLPFLVVVDERFTPGTVGLIASRLAETNGKPTLVAAVQNGTSHGGQVCVGSLRSAAGVDLFRCLEFPEVKELLLTYGGHAEAAGCTFDISKVELLKKVLAKSLKEQGIKPAMLLPTLALNGVLAEAFVGIHLARALAGLEPFGSGNEEPTFLLKNQSLDSLRTVGAENAHLQCRIGSVKSIGFGLGGLLEQLSSNQKVDVACRIGINSWNGKEEVQLFIEDIRRT